jgi:primosomal protein N' (replication factor Y)
MNFYLVAPTARVHQKGYFTYHSEEKLTRGTLVRVAVGRHTLNGVIISLVNKPNFATKSILNTLESMPLPPQLLALGKWLEEYYASPTNAVWQTVLPRGLEKTRRERKKSPHIVSRKKHTFTLTDNQKQAINRILLNTDITSLLQGVTGAGKTAVYIEVAKHMVKNKKSVIILVPEIALTPQLVAEFQQHFSDVVITHSHMTEAERHITWRQCLYAENPVIVIGPRSALFMPLASVGLIVIDECHEPSFKQEQSPRYSALRAARILASAHHAHLVLGSATPSVAERALAEFSSSQSLVRLDTTAQDSTPPTMQLVDMRENKNFSRHRLFSNQLLAVIDATLDHGKQILLFHNRRGSAPYTLCEKCGWTALCQHCAIPLVLHEDKFALLCHTCSYNISVPTTCPECRHVGVVHKGVGTKRIADEIQKLYPRKKIGRFDSDSAKEDRLEARYQALHDGDIDIIIGTQVVAKGLDLPHLAAIGIIQADSGLILPDYTSEERVFQLLTQTMGRVGRNRELSTIVVQSFQPNHTAIQTALSKDFDLFYQHTLALRKKACFPPYCFLLKLTCSYASEKAAQDAARKLHSLILEKKFSVILSPIMPAFYEKVGASYRWQIIVKSKKRSELQKITSIVPEIHWQTDLDPSNLL